METPRPFINRELSWLSFNRRVLEEARNPLIPLLERVKFLAITANNLDEFFMVRVGSLEFLIAEGRGAPDLSGRNPQEQLVDVRVKTHEFMAEQEECYSSELAPKLREEGIVLLRNGTFSVAQRAHIETFFDSEIFPVLSPMRVAENQDLPLLRSLSLHVLVKLSATADHPEPRYAVLPLEPGPSRLIEISENESTATVLLEDVVRLLIHRFFPDDDVEACVHAMTAIHATVNGGVAQALRDAGTDCPLPQGGFYSWPDFGPVLGDAFETSDALATALLEEQGIATLPGTAFGEQPQALKLRLASCDYDGERALARHRDGALDLPTLAPTVEAGLDGFTRFIERYRSV